jgi:glycosyltransferase XagB
MGPSNVVTSGESGHLEVDGTDPAQNEPYLSPDLSARTRTLSPFQWTILCGVLATLGLGLWRAPDTTALILVGFVQAGFAAGAIWRVILAITGLGRPSQPPHPPLSEAPRYAVLVALHDEAEIAKQLVAALASLDWPKERLEGYLLLEAHDLKTIAAFEATDRPDWLQILIVPPGHPMTKPRALNHGLAHCTADLVTVYDAEDRPHPGQLHEAASRFAADETGKLACLQAPLRPVRLNKSRHAFFDRQFALEYAALFDVTLPSMERLNLPFPLGGTSNHFRRDVLTSVGGWDAHNVTEDADLGFRLHARGWRLGTLTLPTLETPPDGLRAWLPQRTRWLKGFMQTWGVHTRNPWRLGIRGVLALAMTLGMAIASSVMHAPSIVLVTAALLLPFMAGTDAILSMIGLSVLGVGVTCAWLLTAFGARRAGLRYGPREMLEAPAYWALLSLAAVMAIHRLVKDPFVWDKTPHRPDGPLDAGPGASDQPISGA